MEAISLFQWNYHSYLPLPALQQREVHLWQAALDQLPNQMDEYLRLLRADELERANRFHFEQDRRRYVTARAILRQLLAGYLHCLSTEIIFSYSAQGKPTLAQPLSKPVLHFNLAHSFDHLLLAFANVEVGVDIEAIRPEIEIELIAPSVFSATELSEWQRLPQSVQRTTFFSLWTRKEALVKAIGQGIGYPLTDCTVGFAVQPPSQIQFVYPISAANRQWQLWEIPTLPDCRAALVVADE